MSDSQLPTTLLTSFDCRQSAVRSVRYNVDGNFCLTSGGDKSVKLWNPLRQLLLKTYTGCGSEVLDACGSADNSQILAGGRDKQPTVFDVETGKMLRRWRAHGGTVNAVALNEDSTVALTASQDGTVNCHDMRSRSGPFQTLNEATDAVLCMDVGGHEIATGSADAHVRLYDLREGRLFVDFMGDAVVDVRLAADGQCMLVASGGSAPLRLIEKANGQLLAEYSGHQSANYRIECGILASNNEVLSGSEDGALYLWDFVESGRPPTRLEHPASCAAKVVHSVTTHPTAQMMMSASRDRVYVWGRATAEEI